MIYSGDLEAEIIFIDATISNYGWYCAVGAVSNIIIGANVRVLIGVLGGVAEAPATVDATVGAVCLALHCVHVCSAVGATTMSATCAFHSKGLNGRKRLYCI